MNHIINVFKTLLDANYIKYDVLDIWSILQSLDVNSFSVTQLK